MLAAVAGGPEAALRAGEALPAARPVLRAHRGRRHHRAATVPEPAALAPPAEEPAAWSPAGPRAAEPRHPGEEGARVATGVVVVVVVVVGVAAVVGDRRCRQGEEQDEGQDCGGNTGLGGHGGGGALASYLLGKKRIGKGAALGSWNWVWDEECQVWEKSKWATSRGMLVE